ncbi:MAG TPA: TPM domain-containing protein, partial [Thermodesulfobacteriota bacterium]|nr:TPM domain-containing protein [Thermodesulfobacteriota bacterium]
GEFLGGILFGGLLAFFVDLWFFHGQIWYLIPLHFLFALPLYLLFQKIPVLKRPFLGTRRKEAAVRRRALESFHEKGLHRTHLNTGVLFFLSLLERKVWVLADKGIYEKIKQETLNQFAGQVSGGVRDRQAGQALIQAIQGVGNLLAEHFPIKPGDRDELPNEVMTQKINPFPGRP